MSYYNNMKLNYCPNTKNKNGFTLAEVLITLIIVGVVASLTIPNVIVKNQKEQ